MTAPETGPIQHILDADVPPLAKLVGLVVLILAVRGRLPPEHVPTSRIARSTGLDHRGVIVQLRHLREAGLAPAELLPPLDPNADVHRAELADALDGFRGPRSRTTHKKEA
jgi:hypothetical protein